MFLTSIKSQIVQDVNKTLLCSHTETNKKHPETHYSIGVLSFFSTAADAMIENKQSLASPSHQLSFCILQAILLQSQQ